MVLDNYRRGRAENLSAHTGDPRLRVIEGDVRDTDSVAAAMAGIEVVLHLAAQSTVMGAVEDPAYNFATNVAGTFNVLEAAAQCGVRRVVLASSREVYGDPIVLPVDEGHPLLPINSYGASKVACEALCRAFARERGIDTAILRLANVYGPRDIDRVIPRWIAQIRSGIDVTVYGGEQVIDFIWVGDVVDAFMRAAYWEGALPPINVASGTGTKILDLARRIAELTLANARGPIRLMPGRAMEVTRFIGDPGRMAQMLGLEPPTDPLAHLRELIEPLHVDGPAFAPQSLPATA